MFIAFRLLAGALAIAAFLSCPLIGNDPLLSCTFSGFMGTILWIQLMIVERKLDAVPAGSVVPHG